MNIPVNPLGRLFIAESNGRGRGVYTSEPIAKNELIELCPVITIPAHQIPMLDKTPLYDYYFMWQDDDSECALALGYGSLYNHSDDPNAEYLMHFDTSQMSIFAVRDIHSGEEITVNYHGEPNGRGNLWFQQKK